MVIMMSLVDLHKFQGALAVFRVALASAQTLWTRMVRMPAVAVGPESSPSTFCASPFPFPKMEAVAKVLEASGGGGFHGTAVCADEEANFSRSDAATRDRKYSMSMTTKIRKRPSRLVLPDFFPVLDLSIGCSAKEHDKVVEVRGRDYFLANKKGRRDVMEDGHDVITNISGDPRKVLFSVIDGHGGPAAINYVAVHLGKNIVGKIEKAGRNVREIKDEEDRTKGAICEGYSVTDKSFLSQGLASGACLASALLKDGQLYVANLGDCRVVLCRDRVAGVLTDDHRVSREDERLRIENSGGFVHNQNGVWRVHGSLTVSESHWGPSLEGVHNLRTRRQDGSIRFRLPLPDLGIRWFMGQGE